MHNKFHVWQNFALIENKAYKQLVSYIRSLEILNSCNCESMSHWENLDILPIHGIVDFVFGEVVLSQDQQYSQVGSHIKGMNLKGILITCNKTSLFLRHLKLLKAVLFLTSFTLSSHPRLAVALVYIMISIYITKSLQLSTICLILDCPSPTK